TSLCWIVCYLVQKHTILGLFEDFSGPDSFADIQRLASQIHGTRNSLPGCSVSLVIFCFSDFISAIVCLAYVAGCGWCVANWTTFCSISIGLSPRPSATDTYARLTVCRA